MIEFFTMFFVPLDDWSWYQWAFYLILAFGSWVAIRP